MTESPAAPPSRDFRDGPPTAAPQAAGALSAAEIQRWDEEMGDIVERAGGFLDTMWQQDAAAAAGYLDPEDRRALAAPLEDIMRDLRALRVTEGRQRTAVDTNGVIQTRFIFSRDGKGPTISLFGAWVKRHGAWYLSALATANDR